MQHIILGSQSPQRFKLLTSLVGTAAVRVVPPVNHDEADFEGLHTVKAIEAQLESIVRHKQVNVRRQIGEDSGVTICADTIVVVQANPSRRVVLGKPPEPEWRPVVHHWFRNYYSGRTHEVWTAFQVSTPTQSISQTVKTEVSMPHVSDAMIEWYLATGEPVGKAGGYGLQGDAAIFVEAVQGSLTSVIGLPMYELAAALIQIEADS